MECRGAEKDTRTELKLDELVLAAPDIDLDVFVERFGADRVGYVPDQLTIYVSPNDKAIGVSNWLFGSARRIASGRDGGAADIELRTGDTVIVPEEKLFSLF